MTKSKRVDPTDPQAMSHAAASRHPCGGAWLDGLASASVDANRRSELLRATVAIAMRDRLLAAARKEAYGEAEVPVRRAVGHRRDHGGWQRNFPPGLLLACMADAELSGTRRLALELLLGTASDPCARARP
jgi:hypothetical protein